MSSNDAPAQILAAAPVPRSRLRGWLTRRARQLALSVLFIVTCLLLVACGVLIKRSASLMGLPDIGDPFDVVAFRAFRIPEDQDAAVLFRQATAKVPSVPHLPTPSRRLGPTVGWSQADPKLREWVEANREALAVFRQGAERPDALPFSVTESGDDYQFMNNLGPVVWLALLEGARHEERGDMAEAWTWYRAVYRMKVHVMRRGGLYQRLFIGGACDHLQPRVTSGPPTAVRMSGCSGALWTTFAPASPSPNGIRSRSSWSISSECGISTSLAAGFSKGTTTTPRLPVWGRESCRPISRGQRTRPGGFLAMSPRRSRRVLRLAFANWLAHADELE